MNHRGSRIIPTLKYAELSAAIDWLCEAFGFERRLVVPDDAGRPIHAQLELDGSLVMLSAPRDDPHSELQRPPRELGAVTQSAYVVVPDADAHHDRAVRAGARIVVPLADAHGGRLYGCTDLEGHLWNFGTYDPWAPI